MSMCVSFMLLGTCVYVSKKFDGLGGLVRGVRGVFLGKVHLRLDALAA